MVRNEVVASVWRVLEPELREQGYELVEVELGRHGPRALLRIFLDKEGGITLDDCQAASQFMGPLLEARDVVTGAYTLEVSSPGFDRPVRKPADFRRFTGEAVKLKTHEPVMGRRRFRGTLAGIDDGLVALDCEGDRFEIHIENVAKANLDR